MRPLRVANTPFHLGNPPRNKGRRRMSGLKAVASSSTVFATPWYPRQIVRTSASARGRAHGPGPGQVEQTANAVDDVPGAASPPSSTETVHESALVPLAAGRAAASLG